MLHFLGDIWLEQIIECKTGNTLLFEQTLRCFPIHPKPPKTTLLKLNFSAMEVGVFNPFTGCTGQVTLSVGSHVW